MSRLGVAIFCTILISRERLGGFRWDWGVLGSWAREIFWDGSFWCRTSVWRRNGRMKISKCYNTFLRSGGFLGLGVMLEGWMLGSYRVLTTRVSGELLGVI